MNLISRITICSKFADYPGYASCSRKSILEAELISEELHSNPMRLSDQDPIESLALEGTSLSLSDVSQLEESIGRDSSNVEIRIRLLGFYFLNSFGQCSNLSKSRCDHIAWFIKNSPSHPIMTTPFVKVEDDCENWDSYEFLKDVWMKELGQRDDQLEFLLAAAYFFFNVEFEIARRFLLLAEQLAPNNCDIKAGKNILFERKRNREQQKLAYSRYESQHNMPS